MVEQVQKAHKRLKGFVDYTALKLSRAFSKECDNTVLLKKENEQITNSFKIRGGANATFIIDEEQPQVDSVVTASAGNHAQGVAAAATEKNMKSLIVMPECAPYSKISSTRNLGGEVVLHGATYDDAYEHARKIAEERGGEFIHAFDNLDVIAGQGTIGLEILESAPDVDAIYVPTGGGGLLAGIASYVKQVNPKVKVYGVQAKGANALEQSFKSKEYITTESVSTRADGIAVKKPGQITLGLINKYVDDVYSVSESEIASTLYKVHEMEGTKVEPAGAVALAHVLGDKMVGSNKRVVCILSGRNIDNTQFNQILEEGKIASGKALKLRLQMPNRPSAVLPLIQFLGDSGVNIDEFLFPKNSPHVTLECSTKNHEHCAKLSQTFKDMGYEVCT
ncbi:MAG: pyridoxal-phosphate dependent enzyme [Firmicutes bacterium]|nr:pyridoxal-phosphate dependent enzyme [Bacillota bacterium]